MTKRIMKLLLLLSVLLVAPVTEVTGQSRNNRPVTLDDRLAAIEARITALEKQNVLNLQIDQPDPMDLDTRSKLDRMEVRIIQLETSPPDCSCGGGQNSALLERMRSLERQVARLRSSRLR